MIWERSSDNKECRELCGVDNKYNYWFLLFNKSNDKNISSIEIHHDDNPKAKKTPPIPIEDLVWLINGDE